VLLTVGGAALVLRQLGQRSESTPQPQAARVRSVNTADTEQSPKANRTKSPAPGANAPASSLG
jgi:hypothetical protein